VSGLTIALNRGRILGEFLPLLEAAGIRPSESLEGSRKLVFETESGGHTLVVMRGSDVPTYVEYGAADVGIVGKDTLLEYGGSGFYERLDLHIGRCRLRTAAPVGADLGRGPLRVATKFVNVARGYFEEHGFFGFDRTCVRCGTAFASDARNCGHCGTRLPQAGITAGVFAQHTSPKPCRAAWWP